jgi:pilus assembly protein CpaE
MIPSSFHVPASVNRGVPIILDEPKHPVSVALRLFADTHIFNNLSSSADSAGPSVRSRASSQQQKTHRRLFHKSVN